MFVAAVAMAVALVAAELALRWVLFGPVDRFVFLRQPKRFAEPLGDDDFWKLQVAFQGEHRLPERPHPVLGWTGWFHADYEHWDAERVGARRPVLLYGDSFAACVPGARSFHEILNGDPEFAQSHYLLNYGVAGYGVDQILLLLQHSIDRYENPIVVLSWMTFDLDRSVLTVRPGQKPRFQLVDGDLVFEPTPILADPLEYHAAHPPSIDSYLYRGLLYSGLVPRPVRAFLTGETRAIRQKEELNERLLLAAFEELRGRGIGFVCLVFHPHAPGISTLDGEPDWRDRFLRRLLEREGVPHIWSKDLLPPAEPGAPFDAARFMIPNDGHPTTEFNELIAARIRAFVLGTE